MCAHACACRNGRSPLLVASRDGHISCVEALIRFNADVLEFDGCVVFKFDCCLRLFGHELW